MFKRYIYQREYKFTRYYRYPVYATNSGIDLKIFERLIPDRVNCFFSWVRYPTGYLIL